MICNNNEISEDLSVLFGRSESLEREREKIKNKKFGKITTITNKMKKNE